MTYLKNEPPGGLYQGQEATVRTGHGTTVSQFSYTVMPDFL